MARVGVHVGVCCLVVRWEDLPSVCVAAGDERSTIPTQGAALGAIAGGLHRHCLGSRRFAHAGVLEGLERGSDDSNTRSH